MIASGSATWRRVPPLWPFCPPGWRPDFSRRLLVRRLLVFSAGGLFSPSLDGGLPLFVLFSRIGIGTWLRDRGLLLSPDEHNGNALLDALEQPSSLPDLCKRDAFVEAVIHPTTQQLQAGTILSVR